MEHANADQLTYEADGRRHAVRTATRCRTCRSKHRAKVDSLLLTGTPYGVILDELPEDHGLKPAGIGEHYRRGHVPAESEVLRRLQDDQAVALGHQVTEDADNVLTAIGLAQEALRRVFAKLVNDELDLTVRDGLRCAMFLRKYDVLTAKAERKRLRSDLMEMRRALRDFLVLVRATVDEQTWSNLARAADEDDTLLDVWQSLRAIPFY